MGETIYDFRSDNVGGAAPELLDALVAANAGTAGPYGDDDWTRRMVERAGAVFERPVRAFPLACGTGSNSIALAALANPFGAIYCHETAHINVHECGAPELFTGAKLVALSGRDYKLSAAELDERLELAGRGNPNRVQPFALNITQPTDFGTLYRPAEVAALAEVAHRHGLKVHMDGARFANAVAALGCTPAEITWRAGVDLLSLGATKNGAINAEALVVFDDALAAQMPFLMKRGGQVLSKARFVSAQIERYLADDRWLERGARRQCACRGACASPGTAARHRDRRAGRDEHALRPHAGRARLRRSHAGRSASTRSAASCASSAGRTRSPRASTHWCTACRRRCNPRAREARR